MDEKIIKYKFKKNKLEEKIINILNFKKEKYKNEIINSNNNEIITTEIKNFFDNIKFNQYKQLVIIVSGFYSVGKTTFINHLENYISTLNNVIPIQKIEIFKDIDYLKNFDLSLKITIIECDINIVDQINLLIKNTNIININIIPKNKNALKNKIINKIIFDIFNKSDNFVKNIENIICENDCEEEKNYLINNINLLKIKNNILTDDDFNFIDKIINSYYDNIINISNNTKQQSNTQKYYL